jgi:hypothetical protein
VAVIYPTASAAVAAAAKTANAPMAWDPTSLALGRFGFGARLSDRAGAFDPDAWWTSQVAAANASPGYSGSPSVAAVGPLLTQTPAQVRAWLKAQGNEYNWTAMDQLCVVTLGLQMFSPAQLLETAVDFFSNHLNVANRTDSVWNTRHDYDRLVIRANALGNFKDMLVASARHPAMLLYLNQAQSTKAAVNENYGRELLELHTVGLNYTEADVKNSAAIMTGRTVNGTDQTYVYNSSVHATGAVTVLGFSDPNATAAGGEAVGDAYLLYLARHALTAHNIARKLCLHYVSDAPSDDLVAKIAAVFQANDTAILPTLYAIFCSDEFWISRGLKTKRPGENLVSTVRAVGQNPISDYYNAINNVRWQLFSMSNSPLECPTPNGYGDVAARWRSAGNLITTWNCHRALVLNWWNLWSSVDPTTFLNGATPATSSDAIDAVSKALVGQVLSAADKLTMQTYLAEAATVPYASSKAKGNLNGIAVILLDSPYFATR